MLTRDPGPLKSIDHHRWLKPSQVRVDASPVLEPTPAERARTILAEASRGALATLDIDGRPVVNPVPIASDGAGCPVTVLSNLTTHTTRARADQRASMSIGDRLLVQGDLVPVPGMQQHELTPAFLHHHPEMSTQVESLDFSWWRLVPTRVRWFGDDGVERWLRACDLAGAEPDPLVELGPDLVTSVADRLGEELVLLAKALAGRWLATDASLIQIDRYGLVAMVSEPGQRRPARIPFPDRLDRAGEIHGAVGALLRAARSAPSVDVPSSTLVSTRVRNPDEPSAASLLDAIERDSGGGPDIEGVDSTGHRDADTAVAAPAEAAVGSAVIPEEFLWDGPVEPAVRPVRGSLFDSLQNADGQSWSLGPDDDGDTLIDADVEVPEVDRVGAGGEGEQSESLGSE